MISDGASSLTRVLSLALVVTTQATQLSAQTNCYSVSPEERKTLAEDRIYAIAQAPTLRFAAAERYFPTFPFATAFGGGRNQDPLRGNNYLQQVELIAPVGGRHNGQALASWNALKDSMLGLPRYLTNWNFLADHLNGQLRQLREERRDLENSQVPFVHDSTLKQKIAAIDLLIRDVQDSLAGAWLSLQDTLPKAPKFAALMYDVIRLTTKQSRALAGLLGSDRRLTAQLPKIADFVDPASRAAVTVIRYYAYYFVDTGLQGHLGDLERTTVFVPEEAKWRVVIGTGHSIGTPNTILAESPGGPQHPGLIVEQGGHSFSPDRPPYGSFAVGWDVNWRFTEGFWGPRDIQAAAGIGFAGTYQAEYTYPRERGKVVTLFPLRLPSSADESGPSVGAYALVPLRILRQLAGCGAKLEQALDSARDGSRSAGGSLLSRDEIESAHFLVDTELVRAVTGDEPSSAGMNLRLPDGASLDSVLARMAMWGRRLEFVPEADERVESDTYPPWTRRDYMLSPLNDFKAWLYRPQFPNDCSPAEYLFPPLLIGKAIGERLAIVDWLSILQLDGGYALGTGPFVRLEVVDPFTCLQQKGPLLAGAVQIALSHYFRKAARDLWSLRLLYDARYFPAVLPVPFIGPELRWGSGTELRLSTGLAVNPLPLVSHPGQPSWCNVFLHSLRVHVGPSFQLGHPSQFFSDVEWQFDASLRWPRFRSQ